MADLDRSGNPSQWVKVWLGPSLGHVMQQVKPPLIIIAGGTVTLDGGASVVLTSVSSPLTLNLPDVNRWVVESSYIQMTSFERSIWIKDIGGQAGAANISVVPFSGQTIDGQPTFTIVSNFALIRLYPLFNTQGSPLFNLTGWFVG